MAMRQLIEYLNRCLPEDCNVADNPGEELSFDKVDFDSDDTSFTITIGDCGTRVKVTIEELD
jgi:hypothetical protein